MIQAKKKILTFPGSSIKINSIPATTEPSKSKEVNKSKNINPRKKK